MRKVFILLSILAATGTISQAQKVNTKNQNTITAWSGAGRDANFRTAAAACVMQGFGIQYSDPQLGIITTTLKASTGASAVRLNIMVTDSTVIFRGQMTFDISIDMGSVRAEASLSDITNKGQKGSPLRESWSAMEKVARELSDSLTYETR